MNVKNVISQLQTEYPGKNVIKNNLINPTEIICEIDPTSAHPDYNVAIAIIDKSKPHYHKRSTEIYEVLKRDLVVNKDGKDYVLKPGDKITIHPGEVHFAYGSETWFKVASKPGWTFSDHILIDENKLAIDTYNKISSIYTKQYFNDITDTPFIDKFLDKLPKGGKVLDVGCGPGQFTKYMMHKGFQVIGIDYSTEMLATARQMVTAGKFRYMDMKELQFEDENFDGILSAYSLIHIPSEDIPQTLQGFHRILKPQGFLEIIAQKGEADKIIEEPFMPSEKMFFNFFTKDRLTKFLTGSRFKIEFQTEVESEDPDSESDKVIYTIARK